jgi:hypothetical protein
MNKPNQMHNSFKIIKTLMHSYSALHVLGTLAPIIRSLLILHRQPPVTVCRDTVTGGCMCRIRRLLMMGARVPETCTEE